VSALHYSAREQVLEGFGAVAFSLALHQRYYCGSEYFYSQCPQVWNLIRTECSLNRGEHRVRIKKAKSIPNKLEIRFQSLIPVYGTQITEVVVVLEVTRGQVDNERQ